MRKELIQKLQKAFPNKTKGNTLELDLYSDLIKILNFSDEELKEIFNCSKSSKFTIDTTPDKETDIIDELVDYLKKFKIDIMNLPDTDVTISFINGRLNVKIVTNDFNETISNVLSKLKTFKCNNISVNSVTVIEQKYED